MSRKASSRIKETQENRYKQNLATKIADYYEEDQEVQKLPAAKKKKLRQERIDSLLALDVPELEELLRQQLNSELEEVDDGDDHENWVPSVGARSLFGSRPGMSQSNTNPPPNPINEEETGSKEEQTLAERELAHVKVLVKGLAPEKTFKGYDTPGATLQDWIGRFELFSGEEYVTPFEFKPKPPPPPTPSLPPREQQPEEDNPPRTSSSSSSSAGNNPPPKPRNPPKVPLPIKPSGKVKPTGKNKSDGTAKPGSPPLAKITRNPAKNPELAQELAEEKALDSAKESKKRARQEEEEEVAEDESGDSDRDDDDSSSGESSDESSDVIVLPSSRTYPDNLPGLFCQAVSNSLDDLVVKHKIQAIADTPGVEIGRGRNCQYCSKRGTSICMGCSNLHDKNYFFCCKDCGTTHLAGLAKEVVFRLVAKDIYPKKTKKAPASSSSSSRKK